MLNLFFSPLYFGVEFLEEIVALKSDHFIINFNFKNLEKLKSCWCIAKAIYLITSIGEMCHTSLKGH